MRFFIALIVLFLSASATYSAPPSDPRATLLYYDKIVGPNDADKALPLYYATTTREKSVALVLAQCDGALANLRAQASAKYGAEIADAMIRSVNATTAADINAAKITVNGDTASVLFPGSDHPATLVRIDGEWKISMKAMVQEFDGNLRKFRKSMTRLAHAADQTAAKIAAGQFPTAEEPSKQLLDAYKKAFADEK